MKWAVRKSVSSAVVAAAVNYVMVVIVAATAAAMLVQTVGATVSGRLLAVLTALKKASF